MIGGTSLGTGVFVGLGIGVGVFVGVEVGVSVGGRVELGGRVRVGERVPVGRGVLLEGTVVNGSGVRLPRPGAVSKTAVTARASGILIDISVSPAATGCLLRTQHDGGSSRNASAALGSFLKLIPAQAALMFSFIVAREYTVGRGFLSRAHRSDRPLLKIGWQIQGIDGLWQVHRKSRSDA